LGYVSGAQGSDQFFNILTPCKLKFYYFYFKINEGTSNIIKIIKSASRDEVTGGWRKLHNEELHNSYSSPSVIRMIKSRRIFNKISFFVHGNILFFVGSFPSPLEFTNTTARRGEKYAVPTPFSDTKNHAFIDYSIRFIRWHEFILLQQDGSFSVVTGETSLN
jgi:hypothetical protein